jgi:hypothetical protein
MLAELSRHGSALFRTLEKQTNDEGRRDRIEVSTQGLLWYAMQATCRWCRERIIVDEQDALDTYWPNFEVPPPNGRMTVNGLGADTLDELDVPTTCGHALTCSTIRLLAGPIGDLSRSASDQEGVFSLTPDPKQAGERNKCARKLLSPPLRGLGRAPPRLPACD